jgi:hypothetical protein
MDYSSIGKCRGLGARDHGPRLWSVYRELMVVLTVHLTGAHTLGLYVASNLATKASKGRASGWEPHHGVRWRRGGQNLAGDEEWQRAWSSMVACYGHGESKLTTRTGVAWNGWVVTPFYRAEEGEERAEGMRSRGGRRRFDGLQWGNAFHALIPHRGEGNLRGMAER